MTHATRGIVIQAVILATVGCGKPPEQKPAVPPPEKGSLQTTVEGFTGKIAVDQGLKAREQIQAASEKRNQALEDVMKP